MADRRPTPLHSTQRPSPEASEEERKDALAAHHTRGLRVALGLTPMPTTALAPVKAKEARDGR